MGEFIEPLQDNDALTDAELQGYVDGTTTYLDLYVTRLIARDLLIARAVLARGSLPSKEELK